MRDHLFISYAWEDSVLAEWLAVKLISEGYKVWIDKFSLLGGESYPRDIDVAIKNEAFRVIALISNYSIKKPNPLKERTLALNIGRERNEDFLITINVDGISVTELDWMISDISYIPFFENWYDGIQKLLKKLLSIETPRVMIDGMQSLCDWYSAKSAPERLDEVIWSNIIKINSLPSKLYKYKLVSSSAKGDVLNDYPVLLQKNGYAWSFVNIKDHRSVVRLVDTVSWLSVNRLKNVAVFLLRECFSKYFKSKGLNEYDDEKIMYFPDGLLNNNRLNFIGWDNEKTFVATVGERTFYSRDKKEKYKYHLGFVYRVDLDSLPFVALKVNVKLYLTDLDGNRLDPRKMNSRRKRICKNWWNREFLNRIIAISQFIFGNEEVCNIIDFEGDRLEVAPVPLRFASDFGIDETKKSNELKNIIDDDIELSIEEEEYD